MSFSVKMKLLGRDGLIDVFVLLDRIRLDALLVVSWKACDTVGRLPRWNRRRALSYVFISPKRVSRGKIARFLDRFRKKPRPSPHEISASTSVVHWDDIEMHFGKDRNGSVDLKLKDVVLPSPEDCYRYLSYGLPLSHIEAMQLSFRPTSSAIAEAFQPPDIRHGCIDELTIWGDFSTQQPNIFEVRLSVLRVVVPKAIEIHTCTRAAAKPKPKLNPRNCSNNGIF